MPARKTIAQLKTRFLQPALTSHFEVNIPLGALPAKVQDIVGTLDQENLNLSCTETNLPGSSMATFEVKNDYTGVTERLAHRRMYDERIEFSFLVDAQKYFPIRIFEKWMRFVAGEDNQGRADGDPRTLASMGYHYRMRFPSEYRCRRGVTITKFERDHRNSLKYEFIGAYPIAVSAMPVSYESSSLLKCSVSMSYLRYVMTELINPEPTPEVKPPTGEPEEKNTKEPPVAQENESKSSQGTDSSGNTAGSNTEFAETDSASGYRSVDDGDLITARQALGLDPI